VVEVTKPDKKPKWIRNGRNINVNEEKFANRYEIISQGLVHKLIIKNVQLKDAGEFVCNVDELSEKCNLAVKECKQRFLLMEISLVIHLNLKIILKARNCPELMSTKFPN
jgi:hypothetical protein